MLPYYASFSSKFSVVMSATISAYKRCPVRLCFKFFVVGVMSDLRYLCLFAYSCVQHLSCCVVCFVCLLLVPCVPNYAIFSGLFILIAPSISSNVYSITGEAV